MGNYFGHVEKVIVDSRTICFHCKGVLDICKGCKKKYCDNCLITDNLFDICSECKEKHREIKQ